MGTAPGARVERDGERRVRRPAPRRADRGARASSLLFTYPLLVDEGRLSERADELKAALEDEAFVEIHPDDAAARGVDRRRPGDGANRRRARPSCPSA